MTKIRILVLLAVVGLLVLWPAVAFAQPAVHRFYGTARLNGFLVSAGAVGGTVDADIYLTTTDATGNYVITVASSDITKSYAGLTVSFSVGGYAANETATWTAGQVTRLDLTAVSVSVPAVVLAGIAGKYDRVWGFDGATETWKLYDPALPAISDLTILKRGKGYWIYAKEAVTLVYRGNSYPLWNGWNLIGWLD